MYIFILLLVLILYITVMALREFFKWKSKIEINRNISINGLVSLGILYLTIAIGFGGLYLILEIIGFDVIHIKDDFSTENPLGHILNLIYFSATTLFSIGYGDLVPIGLGKGIAIVEGLIGYLLPPAFIITFFLPQQK